MIFKPTLKLDKITDVTVDMLKDMGVTSLILDVDNTLSTHHGLELYKGLEEWLCLMKDNNISLIIVSNSTKKRVTPLAKRIGLSFVPMGLKPLPRGFCKAKKELKTEKKKIACVGDQIFTDVLGGKLYGIKTILLTPILPETSLRFRFKRRLEKIIYKHYGW